MNVNLGCGDTRLKEAVNVDFRKTDATDVVHDLTVAPWPFEDEQFENVIATDIVEHMVYVFPFLNECWRIVKPGGKMFIRTTYFRTEQSYRDPTHFHFFTLSSFDFCDPSTAVGTKYHWYTDKKWKVERRDIDGQETVFTLSKIGG